MKNFVFAITMVFVGLVLGIIGWLVNILVAWLFAMLPSTALAEVTVFGITLPVLISLLFIVLLVAGLVAWFLTTLNDRPVAEVVTDTLRQVRQASDGMELLQPLIVSEDGRHVLLALHIEDCDWNTSHPFYCTSVMTSTPAVYETGMYYYLVVQYDGNRISTIAMPPGYGNELQIEIVMRTKGVDRLNNLFWRGLHAIVSESDIPIPFFKLISTAIFVFFIGWSSKRLNTQFECYVQEKLFPHIDPKNALLMEDLPSGVALDFIRCRFRTLNGRMLNFRKDIRQLPPDKIKDTVLALENTFYPFAPYHMARLLFPMQ